MVQVLFWEEGLIGRAENMDDHGEVCVTSRDVVYDGPHWTELLRLSLPLLSSAFAMFWLRHLASPWFGRWICAWNISARDFCFRSRGLSFRLPHFAFDFDSAFRFHLQALSTMNTLAPTSISGYSRVPRVLTPTLRGQPVS